MVDFTSEAVSVCIFPEEICYCVVSLFNIFFNCYKLFRFYLQGFKKFAVYTILSLLKKVLSSAVMLSVSFLILVLCPPFFLFSRNNSLVSRFLCHIFIWPISVIPFIIPSAVLFWGLICSFLLNFWSCLLIFSFFPLKYSFEAIYFPPTMTSAESHNFQYVIRLWLSSST